MTLLVWAIIFFAGLVLGIAIGFDLGRAVEVEEPWWHGYADPAKDHEEREIHETFRR